MKNGTLISLLEERQKIIDIYYCWNI